MKIIDVLREQEEEVPLYDLNHKEPNPTLEKFEDDLKNVYDKLTKSYLYTPSVTLPNGNTLKTIISVDWKETYIVLLFKVFYEVAEYKFPKKIDLNSVIQLSLENGLDKVKEKVDLDSQSFDVQNQILIGIRDINLYTTSKDKKGWDRGFGAYNLSTLLPKKIQDKLSDLVLYWKVNAPAERQKRYYIPKTLTIKFTDDYGTKVNYIKRKGDKVLNALRKGVIDGHTYEIDEKIMTSVHLHRYRFPNDEIDLTKTKLGDEKLELNVLLFSYDIKIDGVSGADVQLKNPDLYKKIRTGVHNKLKQFKISDAMYSR